MTTTTYDLSHLKAAKASRQALADHAQPWTASNRERLRQPNGSATWRASCAGSTSPSQPRSYATPRTKPSGTDSSTVARPTRREALRTLL